MRTLHQYQRDAVYYILNNKYCGLFLDMGMGKTISVLTAINVLKITDDIGKVLIVAPLRVAQMTWGDEIEKWSLPLTFTKVLGTPKQRLEALKQNTDIYITNIDNLMWISKYWDFDTVIIDESSMFKNHQTNRFKELKKLKYSRMILLSGTPAPNRLTEIWPQIYLLDHGLRLGRTVTKFRNKYCVPGCGNGHIVYNWVVKDPKSIYNDISDICISMQNIVKPKVVFNDIYVKLSESEKIAYDNFNDFCFAEIDDAKIDAVNAAVLINKLTQWTGGLVYDSEKKARVTHNRKFDALEDVIQAANGENILIFANYKHEIEYIKLHFGAVHLEKEIHFQKWNKGEINIAIAHPKSCGHGLNMQNGGRIIIWYGLTYSLETYLQANARLARQGQTHTVIINRLIVKGTVDEYIVRALNNKTVNLNELLTFLKK